MRRPLLQGLAIALGAATALLLIAAAGGLTPLENLLWKWRVAWFSRATPPPTKVVIVAVDQASLDWGRTENRLAWPWPREAYVPLLDFCARAGARAVAFDIIFSEDSLYGSADDAAFAAALKRGTPPSVGFVALSNGAGSGWPSDLTEPHLTFAPAAARPPAPRFSGGTFPVRELGNAFSRLGNVAVNPDRDGIYRRIPLFAASGEQTVPSLAVATWLAAQPSRTEVAVTAEGVRLGGEQVPLATDGSAILRFRGGAGAFPTYAAAAVIQSELRLAAGEAPPIDPALFKDAYVLVGLTAPGLFDLRATPIAGVYPGVEIHATALDNLLNGSYLRPAPFGWSLLLTLSGALAVGLVIRFCQSPRQILLLAVLILPLLPVCAWWAYAAGYWLPLAPALCATLATLGGGVLVNYATEGKERRFIKRAFNQYLHPTVIEQLVNHPERLRLGGVRRELTIFFSDLQGFTSLSEKLDPEALTALLNDYLTAMTDIILDSGGTIDKYEGDAIIAFWNAPLDQPDHAERGVRAALACQQRLAELRPAFCERTGVELHMRIGLNTGLAVVGNMGSQRRFDYTMLGDAVNLAARLEGVNKEFATFTLISQATRDQLGSDIPLREVACVGVVGRREPVRIYEPLAPGQREDPAFTAARTRFAAGDFAAAATAFAPLAETDPTAARYLARCRELLEQPPAAWDGVWRLTSK